MSYENVQRTSEPSDSTQEAEGSACVVRPRKAVKRGSRELAERIRDDTLERREARRVEGTTGVVVVVVVREACRVAEGKNKNVFVAIATVAQQSILQLFFLFSTTIVPINTKDRMYIHS